MLFEENERGYWERKDREKIEKIPKESKRESKNWFKRETKGLMYQIKVESKLVKSGKELKIKGKETKNLEMKSIHSL